MRKKRLSRVGEKMKAGKTRQGREGRKNWREREDGMVEKNGKQRMKTFPRCL
jgi:hypothetical protein